MDFTFLFNPAAQENNMSLKYLKVTVGTAGYFTTLYRTQECEFKSSLKGKNEILKLKEPQQLYTHLFFRLQFACYCCLFAERNNRCPLPVEASLSSLHESSHENSWYLCQKKSLYILESRRLEKISK